MQHGQQNSKRGNWEGLLGSEKFPVEKDRYHLYVAYFCPFAHRVLLTRQLKQLQESLPVDIVKPYPKAGGGWRFPKADGEYPGSTTDSLFHSAFLHEVYRRDSPEYDGPFSVPMLWDKRTGRIVNNESADIMRQLNTAFNDHLPLDSPQRKFNFYPEDLRPQIDEANSWIVPNLNQGVYKTGFANDQETYDENVEIVFETLQRVSDVIASHPRTPFFLGKRLTELDIKLYATLIRFDTIYVQHFKCNLGTIRHDFPVINRYLKFLYWKVKGFKETTNFKHIKENYSKSHADINPKAITPRGPRPDIEAWTEEDEIWQSSLEAGCDDI